jgi:hypothetical protein
MDILLKKIELSLNNFSSNDLDELNNRLTQNTLNLTFNSFLKIKNNDHNYIVDDLTTKFENELNNKQNILDNKNSELNKINLELDTIKDDFNNYKLDIDKIIQDDVNKKVKYKCKYYEDHIESIELKHKKDSTDKIQYIENSYKNQIDILHNQLLKSQNGSISQEHLNYFKDDLIKSIKEKNDIHSESSNIKGQFGEDIINNIKNNYTLNQEFYLEDTTHIESNGDFIAHNIYPNVADKILIESKFVKNICTSKNTKHGKGDLVRFEEHYTKFFKENPHSHSIIFSLNSDKIPGKGFYKIENMNGHFVFYVSVNYSKVNDLNSFQNTINLIFHNIVIHIVENTQQKQPIDNNNNNILIKTLEKSYKRESHTINILEDKVYKLQKDLQDFNDLISEHKTNVREIITTFDTINHNFEPINIEKSIMNMSIIHKYIVDNNYSTKFLKDTTIKELQTIFLDLPKKFTKKQLLDDYEKFVEKNLEQVK